MLETRNSANTNPYSVLLALKPRQVLLAEQRTKKEMSTTKTKKQNKILTLNPEQKAFLLHSILRYLERNSYSKTLKRFLSEAQIENDNWKNASLDVEDLYCKYLDTCTHADTNFNTYKERELRTDDTTKKDGNSDCSASEEFINKKKKKKKKKRSDEGDHNAAADTDKKLTVSAKNSEQILANDMVLELNGKSKEKKKSKKSSDSPGQTEQFKSHVLKNPTNDMVCELQMDESTKKHKHKKIKQSKFISESSLGNVEQEKLDSLQGVTEEKSKDLASSVRDTKTDYEAEIKPEDKKKKNKQSPDSLVENIENCGLENMPRMITDNLVSDSALGNTHDIPLEKKKFESKDKKRKKDGSVSERLSGGVVEVPDQENPVRIDSKNRSSQPSENAIKEEKKRSKKRKSMVSNENEYLHVDKEAIEESKSRKTEGLDEAKNEDQHTKKDGSKESKQENGQVDHNEPPKASMKHRGGHANGDLEENGREKKSINQLNEHVHGNLEKNGGDISAVQKTTRKKHNGSAEPKTANAFQRVKIDKVVFADEKLQDNSYWAKDGAEVGYGAKAQEILGQVRGRDFRHEKTKKKRGSYRGGQIDLHSHSVKFNYSDED